MPTHLDKNLVLAHDLHHLSHVRSRLLQQLQLFAQHPHCVAARGERAQATVRLLLDFQAEAWWSTFTTHGLDDSRQQHAGLTPPSAWFLGGARPTFGIQLVPLGFKAPEVPRLLAKHSLQALYLPLVVGREPFAGATCPCQASHANKRTKKTKL